MIKRLLRWLSGIVHRDFKPDWVSPPGETIIDILVERQIAPVAFERAMGLSHVAVCQLLTGQSPITPTIASKLSSFLGSSPEFWLEREAQYRADVRRLS